MSNLLRRHGIHTLPARHGGLIALAGELPTSILADALGIHINTAKRWAGYLQRDWSTYFEARAADVRAIARLTQDPQLPRHPHADVRESASSLACAP